MASRNVENTFVTVSRTFYPDEQRDINSFFVKLRKIGGYVRSCGKSGKIFSRSLSGEKIFVSCF